MYNQPFFIPNYIPPITPPNMMRGLRAMQGLRAATPLMNGATNASKSLGLMRRLGNSLSSLRSINWSGLITNTSKTLGVVNQAIPLVRQVGPMVNNMKSMLKVASLFKDETDKPTRKQNINYQNTNYNQQYKNNTSKVSSNQINIPNNNKRNQETTFNQDNTNKLEDNSPTFFIPS